MTPELIGKGVRVVVSGHAFPASIENLDSMERARLNGIVEWIFIPWNQVTRVSPRDGR